MTNSTANTSGTANDFDRWQSIAVGIFLALAGYTVMVSVPVLSTALVTHVGFSEEQVGRIWGADMLGFSIGALIAAYLVGRMNRRHLIFIGAAVTIGANVLCMILSDYEVLYALRVIAGIGSGLITAVGVVTLGGTTNPVMAYNLELVGFAFSTAFEMRFIPTLTMDGIYLFFMVLAVACALLAFWIPARPLNAEQLAQQEQKQQKGENWKVPKILPMVCLMAICFTYINIGGYFTYIELAALAEGISQDWTGDVLTWGSFLSIAGCVFAYFCQRFGLFKPLFSALIMMAGLVMMLSAGITDLTLVISVFAFMMLWTFVDVYQSAMIAHMDRTGSMVSLLPCVQGFGQFVGPNIAASILGAGLGYGVMFVVSGSMALVALALYFGVFLYMHRRKAALSSTGEQLAN
ncbi:MAG: MFS transporter [Pseudomonadales bacterium]